MTTPDDALLPAGDGMSTARSASTSTDEKPGGGTVVIAVVAWLWVLVPFAYGLWQLIIKIPALFAG